MRRLLVLCLVFLLGLPLTGAVSPLTITVTTDRAQYSSIGGLGINLWISGRVTDSTGRPVMLAAISTQLSNSHQVIFPLDGPAAWSNQSGFYHSELVFSEALIGMYTVLVVATKSGYSDGQAQTQFSIVPESASQPATTSQIQQQVEHAAITTSSIPSGASFPSWAFLMIAAIAGAILLISVILGLRVLFRPRRDQEGLYP